MGMIRPVYLILVMTLCSIEDCCAGVHNDLPFPDELENLTMTYPIHLEFTQQRLFPTLQFTFNGYIIGWKIPAIDHRGGLARPQISVWKQDPNPSSTFTVRSTQFIDSCITDKARTVDGTEVVFHESGPPSPGLIFQSGDILGLLLRSNDVVDFIPLLYDGSLQSLVNPSSEGYFSYYVHTRGPRNGPFTVTGTALKRDGLLPLLSLELCSTDPNVDNNMISRCNGTTFQRSGEECSITEPESTITTTAELSTNTTTAELSTNTTATTAELSTNQARPEMLLITTIAVPVALFCLLAIIVTIFIIMCCLFARKRKHSTYTTDIALKDFQNGTIPDTNNYSTTGPPVEYATLDPTFVISVTAAKETAILYEDPVTVISSFNSSGEIHCPVYDSPSISRHTSARSTTSLTPIPHRVSFLENSPSTITNESGTFLPPPSGDQKVFSLFGSLRKSKRLMFRKSSSGAVPNKSTAKEDSPGDDRFFRLETGMYVPTKDQRNHFATIESLFDDKAYASFSEEHISPQTNNWSFFEESKRYWKPASDSSSLFDQLANQKYREINRKQIEILEHLGSGEFGTVCHGLWHTEQGDLDVAVKMLNKQSSERDTVRFIQEAAIMGQFKHPNIVRLHGVVTMDEPMMIVLELVENGDLRKNLKQLKPAPGEVVSPDLPQKLLDFCSQIALGMEYLSRREFVHRDLAARNILVTEDSVCKIADFGMSRDLDNKDYYVSLSGKISIKWAALETMHYRKFSTSSDVWSFGVLMYEVWSLGKTPFTNKTSEQTITLVGSGYRLAPPPGCPRAIYNIMIQCWNPESCRRPSFTKLLRSLSRPTDTLLYWSPNDSNIHYQASVLGAELEVGLDLYPVLQKSYMYSSADSD